MRAVLKLKLLFLAVILSGSAQANKAHVHGIAKLAIALEGNDIEIEFSAPASDIFGFESPRAARKNKEAVDKSIEKLKDISSLFEWKKTSPCKLKDYKFQAFGKTFKKSDERHEHKHDHKKHNHKHEKHDHKKNKHDHDSHDHEEHSELIANYQLSCSGNVKQDGFNVALIKGFPSLKSMYVIVFTGKNQLGRKEKNPVFPVSFAK